MINNFPETADIETSSNDYAQRFSGSVGKYFLDIQFSIVIELLRPYKTARILDVGGGHAQLAIPLCKKGFDITVTGSHDSCENRLKEELAPKSYKYDTCSILDLPYDSNSFDVVLAFRLIPHVDRWQELLAELARVSNHAVIVDYPDIRSINILNFLFFRLKRQLEGNTRSFSIFRRKQIVSEFAKHGMECPIMKPEFFLPMVLHRKMGSAKISSLLEWICRKMFLTKFFGSPIVLCMVKRKT